jgi:hypothetical protein
VELSERPADRLGRRLARDAEAGQATRRDRLAMKGPRRLAGHVEEPSVVNPEALQVLVDPTEAELGEVGQRRPQVRGADRRQAQDTI